LLTVGEAAVDPPFKPFKLGRYNVLLPLGEGGMAEVLLAEQVGAAGFTRLCTIKRIKTNLVTDPEYLRMFVDEARILVNIQHPNVVQVLDLQQEGPDLYMVLEYVTGGDVRHLLKALNSAGLFMPVPVACYVAWSALRGLVQAHNARGPTGTPLDLIHRDISPGNILLGRNGTVKLSDFGVAKAAGRLSQTTDGSVKGSLAYMAPEMLEQGRADQRADIFSAGVVLWEMLTCRRLFPGLQPTKLVAAILTKDIPVPSSIQPSIPRALDELVLRAVDRDPARRFQNARDLEMALYQLVKDHHPDELEQALAALVKDHVTLRSAEDIALLPRPAHELDPDAITSPPATDSLGTLGPPPVASTVDDFFASGAAFSQSDVPAPAAAAHDDFFLPPPPLAPAGLVASPEPPGDDFFNLVVTAPKTAVPVSPLPPPAATAHPSDTDFSSLSDTPGAHALLAQPLPSPGFSLDGGLPAPSLTAMADMMDVPPVTMPLGLPPPSPAPVSPSWSPQQASGAAIGSDFSAGRSLSRARLEQTVGATPPPAAAPFHGDAVPSMAAAPPAPTDDFFSLPAPGIPVDLDATLPPARG
jgi:serine/threonine-protein kinase